jgi:hypothetical protein
MPLQGKTAIERQPSRGGPGGFPAATRIRFALVLISIFDYETNGQNTPVSLLSQNPTLTTEAWTVT